MILTKLQFEILGMSLIESEQNTDSLLNGNAITIIVEKEELLRHFIDELESVGVMYRIMARFR